MLNKQRRWFHSSRVKLPLVKIVGELVFGIDAFDLDFFWVQNWFCQITNWAQLCEFLTRVPLLALVIIILTAASLSSKILSKAPKREGFALVVTWSTLNNSRSPRLGCFFVLVLVRFLDCSLSHKFPWRQGCLKEECNTSITKLQRSTAGIQSMRKPASKEITSD